MSKIVKALFKYTDKRNEKKEYNDYLINRFSRKDRDQIEKLKKENQDLMDKCDSYEIEISILESAKEQYIDVSVKESAKRKKVEAELVSAREDMAKSENQLSDLEEQLQKIKSQNENDIQDIYENILSYVGTSKEYDGELNFYPEFVEETGKWKVTTSICQLCGDESRWAKFTTEAEARLFCIIKTLAGHQFGNTCHVSCVIEYEREHCL